MTALAKDRLTPAREGHQYSYAAAAAKKFYAGAIVMVNASGYATPGATATGLVAAGRSTGLVDNSAGAAGDLKVPVERGIFQYANSAAGDAIAVTDVGEMCYVVDDQTVAKTSGSGTRSRAGRIADVDAQGVWVDMREAPAVGKVYLTFPPVSTKASDAAVARRASPVAGRITNIQSVLNVALATGDATLTGKIGATAITTGVLTITQAGSAAGDVDSAVPTALNAVAVGDVISFTGGGASTATSTAEIVVEITL